jgi:hypothetical protein
MAKFGQMIPLGVSLGREIAPGRSVTGPGVPLMTWFDLIGRAWCRRSASDVTMQVRALGPILWRSFGRPPLVGAVGVIALARGHLRGCASANGLTGIGCVVVASSRARVEVDGAPGAGVLVYLQLD